MRLQNLEKIGLRSACDQVPAVSSACNSGLPCQGAAKLDALQREGASP
jgi:hypothetical protein